MDNMTLRILAEDAIDNIDYPGSDSALWASKAKDHVKALADVLEDAEAELTRRDEQLRVAERYRGIYQSRANERAEELNVLGDVNASLKEQLTQKVPEEFHALWRRIANQRRSPKVLHRWNEMLNRWGDDQAIELRKLRLAAAPVSLEAGKAAAWTEGHDQALANLAWPKERKSNPYLPVLTEGDNRG